MLFKVPIVCPFPSNLYCWPSGEAGSGAFSQRSPWWIEGNRCLDSLPGLLSAAFSLISQLCCLTPGWDSEGSVGRLWALRVPWTPLPSNSVWVGAGTCGSLQASSGTWSTEGWRVGAEGKSFFQLASVAPRGKEKACPAGMVCGGERGQRTKWLYWLPWAGRGSEHKRWSLSSHSIIYLVPFKHLPAQLHFFQTSQDALGKQLKLCGSHFPLCTKGKMITSCGRVCLSKRSPQNKWTWLISIFICMNINTEELNKTELLTSKSMSTNPVLLKSLIKTNT